MKRTLSLVLGGLVLLSLASGAFADQKSKPAKVQHKVFVGALDSVTPADPAKNVKATIVVLDKQNAKKAFAVGDKVKIFDAKGAALPFDKLQKGQEVRVRYVTTADGDVAAVIRLRS